jgi:hypothetical protein
MSDESPRFSLPALEGPAVVDKLAKSFRGLVEEPIEMMLKRVLLVGG